MSNNGPTTKVLGQPPLEPKIEEVPADVIKKPVRDKDGVPYAGNETDPVAIAQRGAIETGRKRAAGEIE